MTMISAGKIFLLMQRRHQEIPIYVALSDMMILREGEIKHV